MYKDMIEKLTLEQKIEIMLSKNLLRDIIVDDFTINHTDCIDNYSLQDENTSLLYSIANSWNLKLVQFLANEMVKEVQNRNTNIIFIPFGNSNAYSENDRLIEKLNEDVHLTKKLLNHYISTFHSKNIYVMGKYFGNVLSDPSSEELMYEALDIIKSSQIDGVIIYNDYSFADFLKNQFKYEGLILIRSTDVNNQPIYSIYSDIANKYSSKSELEEAIIRYKEYKMKLEADSIDDITFYDAIDQQIIIDENDLDEQILKVYEFLDNLSKNVEMENEERLMIEQNKEDIFLQATEESFVLLKNDRNILPVSSNLGVALIGDFDLFLDQQTDETEISTLISNYIPNFLGFYEGFDSVSENFNELVVDLLDKIKDANIVIVKIDSPESKFKLSSSQINLISKLYETSKIIILILSPTIQYIDKEWENYCSVIITGQVLDTLSMRAFLNILVGDAVPSGKLNHAIYQSDITPLIKYPFGFGLSYATFQYSNLIYSKDRVQFTLSNTSKKDGFETIQLYIYHENYIEEKKLIGFNKVFLTAGETKTIAIEFEENLLYFSDVKKQQENIKVNIFTLEVSSSKNKVELYTKLKSDGREVIETKMNTFQPNEFQQTIVGNVRKPFNWRLLIAILFTLLINIIFISILRFITNGNYYRVIIIFLVGIDILLYKLIKDILKIKEKRSNKIDSLMNLIASIEYLEVNNEEVYITDETINDLEKHEKSSEIELLDSDVDENGNPIKILRPREVISKEAIYDVELQIENYCDSLCQYMAENGLKIEKSTAREILSCFAASRVIILNSKNSEISSRFIEIYSDFIGANYFNDTINPEWNNFSSFFKDANYLGDCMESADMRGDLIHIMELDNVDLSRIDSYFSIIIDYATNPSMPCYFEELKYIGIGELPKNIWFMLSPTKFDVTNVSSNLLQCSTTIDIDAKIVIPQDIVYQNEFKLSYNYLMDAIRDSSEIYYVNEELWKKVDEIEYYVNERVPFTIDNRVFRQLERYTTMYIMCGGEDNVAIDSVLSSKLLIMIARLSMRKKEEDNEGLFALCERLFGLENLLKSKTLLKYIEEVYNLSQ